MGLEENGCLRFSLGSCFLTSNMYGNASTLYETFRHTLNLLLRASGTHLTGLGNLGEFF